MEDTNMATARVDDAAAVLAEIQAIFIDEAGEWIELQSCADAVQEVSLILDRFRGPRPYEAARDDLVSAAAEASETFGDDELEAYAQQQRAADVGEPERDEVYERAAARDRADGFAKTGGKDWT